MKRGYSRAFTARTERRVTLTLDRIPPTLLDAAKAKAKREGVSLRALILGWLKEWSAENSAHHDRALRLVSELASYECAGIDQDADDVALCGKCGPCEANAFLRETRNSPEME